MEPTPILIISDSISGHTGLGRISRDLALRIHRHLPEFKIATYGYGAPPDPKLPVQQFSLRDKSQGGVPELPKIWAEFTGSETTPGIILSITNAQWVPWLARPDIIEDKPEHAALKSWLKSGIADGWLRRWLYFPVDSDGPNQRLHPSEANVVLGFDRYLTYTNWAAGVMSRTFEGHPDWDGKPIEWLPHGIDTSVFRQRNRRSARHTFLHRLANRYSGASRPSGKLDEDSLLLGAVATNTPRKDWPLAFETLAELVRRGNDAYLWAHVDRIQAWWDLPTLAAEFGVTERVIFTSGSLPDEQLAWLYSGLDCFLANGSGEGFGFGAVESLACQTPVVHGNFAGGADLLPKQFLVEPVAFSYDGFMANRRPIFNPSEWADKVIEVTRKPAFLPEYLDWNNLWAAWSEWLRSGL